MPHLPLLTYIRLKLDVLIIRFFAGLQLWKARRADVRMGLLPPGTLIKPSRTVYAHAQSDSPTRKWRKIKILVHEPPNYSPDAGPLPVHINLHGSGFVIPLLGVDEEQCAYISRSLGTIVLDADYSKGPEHPFPAAYSDVLAVLAYVQSHPNLYDLTKLTIGGQSAGGNLALAAACNMPKGTFKGVQVFYPSTDMRRSPGSGIAEPPPKSAGPSDDKPLIGTPLTDKVRRTFMMAYIPPGTDTTDPRLSPTCAAPGSFPPVTMIFGDADPLYPAGQALYEKLKGAGNDVEMMVVPGVGHAWERFVQSGTPLGKLRTEAFEVIVRRIKEAHDHA